jgi:hypothetical protein
MGPAGRSRGEEGVVERSDLGLGRALAARWGHADTIGDAPENCAGGTPTRGRRALSELPGLAVPLGSSEGTGESLGGPIGAALSVLGG